MSDPLGSMGDTAKTLSRNPLGIIALFIVLVYGMAALVLAAAATGLGTIERLLLVLFMVGFPPAVLWVFRDMVLHHTGKLYSPADFKEEQHFMAVVTALSAASGAQQAGRAAASPPDPERLAAVARRATAAVRAAPRVPRIFWVDDKPLNNLHERRALEAAGFVVEMVPSTDAALRKAEQGRYDAVISNMARPEGQRAGYDLLERLGQERAAPPLLLYTSSDAPEHRAEAKQRGAVDSINDPDTLLERVSEIVRG